MTDMIQHFENISGRCRQREGDLSPLRVIAGAAEREGRPLASPLRVQVEITDTCRQRCLFCIQGPQGKARENQGPVPREQLRLLSEELAFCNVAEVVITGGEPACHPELVGIVGDFKAGGMRVVLETSGADLSRSILSDLAFLLDPEQDLVRVSMDAATAETYRVLRGVDAFGNLVEVLNDLGRLNMPFATATVIMGPNRQELARIANHAREAGARACDFGPPFLPGGSSLPGELELGELLRCCEELLALPADIPIRLHTLHAARKAAAPGDESGSFCTAGLTECAVDVKGRIAACSYLNDAGLSQGTWEPGTFADLWEQVGETRSGSERPCTFCHR